MARMVPSYCAASAPAGERMLFATLKASPETAGWVVFHSLGLARHPTKIQGEVDLVAFVPGHGIVCVEVKSCRVSRHDGVWEYHYAGGNKRTPEGPFRQASSAAHALRRYLDQRDRRFGKVFISSLVIFTAQEFVEKSPEWHRWEYLDAGDLERSKLPRLIVEAHRATIEHVARIKGERWISDHVSPPATELGSMLVGIMRADFETFPDEKRSASETLKRIDAFTEEQFAALDAMADNDRVIFEGAAGTGKTILALEAARRESIEGRRTLLVCFNSMLGRWLGEQSAIMSEGQARVECSTMHALMASIADRNASIPRDSQYWDQLASRCVHALLERGEPAQFESLIVDEAQDLAAPEFLDVFELLLVGGLAKGRWRLFGDFAGQTIFQRGVDSRSKVAEELRSRKCEVIAKYRLTVNCRNASTVADTIQTVCAPDPGYSRVLDATHPGSVTPHFVDSPDDELRLVSKLMGERSKVFGSSKLLLLSGVRDQQSVAHRLVESGARGLYPRREGIKGDGAIPYCTIHAFKGMEADAVIITDLSDLREQQTRSLLYVGLSRARMCVDLVLPRAALPDYEALVMQG